jgi:hypothetical protein
MMIANRIRAAHRAQTPGGYTRPTKLKPLILSSLFGTFLILCPSNGSAQAPPKSSLPRIVQNDGRYALLVDGKPYLMLGAQVNNSSAWPAMLPKVWPVAEQLGVNTLEVPIYWEQFEPEQGHFDPSLLHTLLAQARQHHVHLVLLWFGTWKNGSGHYTPPFIKLNEALVPHVIGADGSKIDSLSPFSEFALKADSAAFAELMRDLRAADPQHTVLMVQVENEPGTYGTPRDYSPTAQKLFEGQVPPDVLKAMQKSAGTWSEVFGENADEYFHAYSVAHYIGQVAAAGRLQYELPLYINVALRDPLHPGVAGKNFESGGATDDVLPIWKAADYATYTTVLDRYHRPDNAMFVPETGNSPQYARYFFAALGHQAIGFSPFGMDDTAYVNSPLGATRMTDAIIGPFALNYRIFGPMDQLIARLNFEGKLKAVAEDPSVHMQLLDFGKWKAKVSYGVPQFGASHAVTAGNSPPDGGVMVAQLGPDEFLVTGVHSRVDFEPTQPGLKRQFLKVEEGFYRDGAWHFLRIWNGDQTDWGLNFTSAPQVLHVSLATY